MSLQRTTQIVNNRTAAGLDTGSTSSFALSHRESTCFAVIIVAIAAAEAAGDFAAIDIADAAVIAAATTVAG
ncbi:hypothetical protein ATY41_00570 [Leifsonia xyli subsp. xyli]|uniref:Uncharacterized protein n=1 Tax=Leifsonia xyli subsp. xyli TaxID=59736 RepID=A0A1E2SN91_LEIXY|nr:hypothetical protein [Leifsonia xyli]ODA91230.1 hypothetical protein ATY41_00570 [Leifsonia xyli subsp. xyli]